MSNAASLALVMATLGQIAFCITALFIRPGEPQTRVPLGLFLLACGVVLADPVVLQFAPSFRIQTLVLSLPAYLLMAPVLWLYVEGLTSESPWVITARHGRHFIPFGLGLLVSVLVIALPPDTLEQVFVNEDLGDSRYLGVLFTIAFVLIVGLVAQTGFYLVKMFLRLNRYRRRIKMFFANIEHRELLWINIVLALLVVVWGVVAVGLVSENFANTSVVSRRFGEAMGLVLVWITGLWGLRQVPGFEGRYPDADEAVPLEAPKTKYRRSALSDEDARRIAEKIETAMQRDRVYLDSELSLAKLSAHLGASTNHVSQTLNETLGMNFFDYINRCRIEASKPKILRGDEAVLTIALSVGFNTSSSFYKAFKKETGKTPGAFRTSN